jgi:hypothetical protein
LFTFKRDVDIFPHFSLKGDPDWESNEMVKVQVKNVERHFVFGVGGFYPDRMEVSPFGPNVPFRWTNGYINFGVYSDSPSRIALEFPVMLGGDFQGKFKPSVNLGKITSKEMRKGYGVLSWNSINLAPGWNVLELKFSSSAVYATPKNSLRPDFRPLSVAVGKMKLILEEK